MNQNPIFFPNFCIGQKIRAIFRTRRSGHLEAWGMPARASPLKSMAIRCEGLPRKAPFGAGLPQKVPLIKKMPLVKVFHILSKVICLVDKRNRHRSEAGGAKLGRIICRLRH